MELADINALLQRQVKDGKEFDKLFVKVTCQSTNLGTGMTDHSVTQMAEWAKKYSWQTKKVAQRLKQRSLQSTCKAIHDFAYWHFQYKLDENEQMLRSPACSWYSRYDGIDCKSYSILASCILMNLGISHYIRRIKQPGHEPHLFTHVYIVVPVDQETGKLTKGHYVIDGTVLFPIELYTEKSDLYMSMQHIGLNGALPQRTLQRHPQPGLNGVFDGLKNISTGTVTSMFQPGWKPSCINGSMNDSHVTNTINVVVPAYNEMVKKINESVAAGSPTLLADINKMIKTAWQMFGHSKLKAMGNWSSSCSKRAAEGYHNLGIFYFDLVNIVFDAWLKHYFDITVQDTLIPNNTFDIPIAFDKNSDVAQTSYRQVMSIKPKSSTTQVKAFEFTAYVADKANVTNFDLPKFLDTLKTVAVVFAPKGTGTGTGTGTTTGEGEYIDPATGKPLSSGNKISTMGAGIGGFLLVAASAAVLFSGMKDKPAKPATSPVATKKNKSKKQA